MIDDLYGVLILAAAVDNGYSNFGASCGINTSLMTFTGKINTD